MSLSEELLEAVDKYCKDYKYNRSEFIRHAVRYLFKHEFVKVKEDDNTIENKTAN